MSMEKYNYKKVSNKNFMLKSINTNIKAHWMSSKEDFIQQEKISVNLKIVQYIIQSKEQEEKYIG